MHNHESLASRVREMLAELPLAVEEKTMFQGITFMVDNKMLLCVGKNDFLFRIGEDQARIELERSPCRQMIHNGRLMKHFVFVDAADIRKDVELRYWVDLCLRFNSQAKPSKKKKGRTDT